MPISILAPFGMSLLDITNEYYRRSAYPNPNY